MKARALLPPLALVATILAMLVATLAGCAPRHDAHESADGTSERAADSVAAQAQPSLFELDFPLVDRGGHERHLAEFAGGPVVASMVYTSCKSVCPRITADLQALDHALPPELRARTRFVLFSLDPARDTPAALAAFAREHELDARWTLLAAKEDDMRTLAAILGVRFRPDAGGEIAHSAVIAVLDGRGVLRHRQMGLGADTAPLVQALRSAASEPEVAHTARR